MRLVNPSVEIKEQELGLNGVYKQIEWAGRHCYKSLDKITDNSYKQFYNRMKRLGHLSVLEHGSIYLKINILKNPVKALFYALNKFSKIKVRGLNAYVSSNLRVIEEGNRSKDTKYICKPTKYHDKRYTFRIITSRVISQQFMRHRVMSFSQESQRYCNYSKGKFNSELQFINPIWYADCSSEAIALYETHMEHTEKTYFSLIKEGLPAEDARDVLNNGVKTEFIYTGFKSDFMGNFHKLRSHHTAQKLIRIQEKEIYNTIKQDD